MFACYPALQLAVTSLRTSHEYKSPTELSTVHISTSQLTLQYLDYPYFLFFQDFLLYRQMIDNFQMKNYKWPINTLNKYST